MNILQRVLISVASFALACSTCYSKNYNQNSGGICLGRVANLQDVYNPATGSGFLALRAGPKASAMQLDELFEGERVIIISKAGQWLQIITSKEFKGWVSSKYIDSTCK